MMLYVYFFLDTEISIVNSTMLTWLFNVTSQVKVNLVAEILLSLFSGARTLPDHSGHTLISTNLKPRCKWWSI